MHCAKKPKYSNALMEEVLRIIRPPRPNISETQFLSLNDDCIYEIFGYLSLDDLCSISETCQRLHQLSGNYFRRKHPDVWLELSTDTVKLNEDGTFLFMPKTWTEKCFGEFYQNLIIRDNFWTDIKIVFKFVQSKCAKKLKKVLFEQCYPLMSSHGNCIKDQLKYVEMVEFNMCSITENFFDCLEFSRKLKLLKITNCYGENANGWTMLEFPRLNHFEYSSYPFGVCPDSSLATFLRQNQSIETCKLTLKENVHNTVNCVVTNTENLKNFSVTFDGDGNSNFKQIKNDLCQLHERINFRCLEVNLMRNNHEDTMSISTWDALVPIKSIKKLIIDIANTESKNIIKILQHIDVQFIRLSLLTNFNPFFESAIDNFSDLEHLVLNGNRSVCNSKHLIEPFVLLAPKLRNIVIYGCYSIDFTEATIAMLNEQRRKIPNACRMLITIVAFCNTRFAGMNNTNELLNISTDFISFQTKYFKLK